MKLFGNLLGGGSSLVGVDVGASAIKLLKGRLQRNQFHVEACVVVPLPPGSIDERGITNGDAVASALRSAFDGASLRSPSVAAALHGAGVLTKRISLSKQLPKKEIPNQVRWEAEQVFPVDVASILVEHLILGERANVPDGPPGTPGWDILLVGVRTEVAAGLRDLFANAGADPKVMDLDAFVVGDLLDAVLAPNPAEAVALVDIGATATRISVRHKGNITFVREFYMGGNAFTEAIASTLGLSFEDAEALKIGAGGIPTKAQEALRTAISGWKTELQQSEDIFVMQEADVFIARWVLFGGGVSTPGLLESLNDDRFGGKAAPLAADQIFVSKNKALDPAWLAGWSPRLLTAAGLCGRKG